MKENKASGRNDRHCHLPSASRGEFQEDRSHVLKEIPIPTHLQRLVGNTWTQTLLARDELDGWLDLRPKSKY